MLGRMIKVAALAGAGTLAWRWWQNKQAEDRAYAGSESLAGERSEGAITPSAAATGTRSPVGARVDQVPAQ